MTNFENVKKLKIDLRKMKSDRTKKWSTRAIVRTMALIAYFKGTPINMVAQSYDISLKTLKNWIKNYESFDSEGLDDQARSGRPVKLPKEKQEELKNIIKEQNNRVWVARHVYVLLISIFGGPVYCVKYIPEFLRKLGLSFHKAVHNLIKKDNKKRKEWIMETLPQIYQKKIKEGWRIFYQDEVGFQTEGTLASTWGPKGERIEIKNYGRHGRMNLMGAFELGTGIFYGVLTSFRVNAMRFRRFICHLKRKMRTEKILLICDNASFHKAKWFTEWTKTQKEWLKIEFLPAYSPDFNPIERLWHWIKTEYTHNQCWKTKTDLRKYLLDVIHEIPSHANSIRSIMKKENERFEGIFNYYKTTFIEQFQIAA